MITNKGHPSFFANDGMLNELLLCRLPQLGMQQQRHPCGDSSNGGPLFLCILNLRVVVDNQSNISYYSHHLTCLAKLMAKVYYNIIKFNNEVQNIVYQLESRGESIQHLMVNFLRDMKLLQIRNLCPTSA